MTDGGQAILPVPRARGILFFTAIAVVFLGVRLALLAARDPFFDELFTLWMARQPLSHVIPNLLHDSGPPLYYFLARFDSVNALRLLSLLFASMQFFLVVRRSLLAGALLALYPPAVLFAVDARAYALCALLVTAGVCALNRSESGRPARSERASRAVTVDRKPGRRSLLLSLSEAIANGSFVLGARSSRYLAAICFALAAHSHYYGVLFFPLLLLPLRRRTEDRGPRTEDRLLSLGLATLLFLPGFLLASKQPVAAMKWNREPLLAPLTNLSFSGTYPYALFAGAPIWLALLALAILVVALSRSVRFAPAVLVPLALVFAFHLAGRPVYFPMRFEAVIAGPLMLWAADSLDAWEVPWRRAIAGSLAVLGAISVTIAILDHERRPMDPYRQAANALRLHTRAGATIVATGYLYLETVTALDRPVIAWPAEQAQHPGWRAVTRPDPAALPTVPFVWIGERYAPEIPALRGVKALRPLFWNERALVAQASNLTGPVH